MRETDPINLHSESRLASLRFEDQELLLEFINFAPHPFHKVPTHFFRMLQADSREALGEISLRVSAIPHIELYGGHIGYTVYPAHRGNRYAARSLQLLIQLARELQLDPIWITCDPENLASRRSCEIAGAKLVEIIDVPETALSIAADTNKSAVTPWTSPGR